MRTAALALAAFLLAAPPAPATPIGPLDEADRAVVEALALYDEATARHALRAATEADVLTDLVYQQDRSRERFQQLLSPHPRDLQEQLFEITRHPDLIARIVESGPKTGEEIEAIAALYPEEARAAALAAGSSHWKLVARIDALLRDEASWLEARIAHLPEAKREAFRQLLETPELMSLLAENVALAVLLGDAYEREPEVVIAWLADLRRQAEVQSAEQAREFARGVESDPDLAGEIAAATSSYQQETGYSAYQPTFVHLTTVQVRPYSWWVGYPWWYDASYGYYEPWCYWYPRAYWAFGGFHFGPRRLVFFGLPHGGFWGWYFHRPIHHSYYPRVTHHVVRHYQRHYPHHPHRYWQRHHRVRHHHSAGHAVTLFRRDAERFMPRAFLRDDGNRIDRFREYGRLRSDGKRERRGRRDAAGEGVQRTETLARVETQGGRYQPAVRIARAEPATRPKPEQPRIEVKRRATAQRSVVEQPPRQRARVAPRAPEPRRMQPEPPRRIQKPRVQNQRSQPKARRAGKEHPRALHRLDARGGLSPQRTR